MNIISFGIRAFPGIMFFGLAAGLLVKENSPVAALLFLLVAVLYFWPLGPIFGRRSLLFLSMPIPRAITWAKLLSYYRGFWGFALCSAAVGAFLDKDYRFGIPVLVLGMLFIYPLDRLVFSPPPLNPDGSRKAWIVVLRNIGLFVYMMGFGPDMNKDRAMDPIYFILHGVGLCLLLTHPVYTLLKGGKLSLATYPVVSRPLRTFTLPDSIRSSKPAPAPGNSLAPGPAPVPANPLTPAPAPIRPKPAAASILLQPRRDPAAPVSSAQNPVLRAPATPQSASPAAPKIPPPAAPRIPPPAQKTRKKPYSDAYRVRWSTFSTSEAQFNQWIRDFQADWLQAKEYRERLDKHRDPEELKNEWIEELTAYIREIQGRGQMHISPRKLQDFMGPFVDNVPDRITRIWKSDKQLRSLYNAMKKYASLRGSRGLYTIAPHIAEYRAMINLVKMFRRMQAKPAVIPATPPSAPAFPAFSTETFSTLSDETYFTILDYIILLGKNLESYKDLNEKFNEERYRDYFLPFLNAVSPHYSAKGEVFNRKGKTDILVCDNAGNNIFIAECKLWKGQAYLLNGIDQLLNNYVSWRDEKTAIIVFNRDVRQFSELLITATAAMEYHPLCKQAIGKRAETSWSYLFRHPNDENRTVRLELVLLNFT